TKSPKKSLYELVEGPDSETETRFVDAVNANLRKGRILILVVGDGIRSETERLAELVQSHAGAHFTFGLVELALYGLPEPDDILVCPRILAKTQLVLRGIVDIHDHRTVVRPADRPKPSGSTPTGVSTITSEQFFEVMNELDPRITPALQSLIEQLGPLGVFP